MFIESCRALGFIPNFSKVIRHGRIGVGKFFSTKPIEKLQDENERKDLETIISKYPEFVPLPDIKYRNPLKEKLERREMLRRRNVIALPEFYVGTVMAVTTSDKHAPNKFSRFVGICIMRNDWGLSTTFLLRNVVDHQGVEVLYSLYSPVIQKIEILKLEKRLDDELFYLRDAPNEYSTFPFDMVPEYLGDKKEVPVNTIKVKLNPRPWLLRYERMDLKGVELPPVSEKLLRKAKQVATPWVKYDLVDEYRQTIPEEEKADIFSEICQELKQLESRQKTEKRKKVFTKVTKQTLF